MPSNGHLSQANDVNNLASTKQHLVQLSEASTAALFNGLNGSSMGLGMCLPPSLGSEVFPSDLDLDIFSGSLECDVDSIINSDLMDADGLDFDALVSANFDALLSVQNAVNLNPVVGNLNGTKAGSQSWVPG